MSQDFPPTEESASDSRSGSSSGSSLAAANRGSVNPPAPAPETSAQPPAQTAEEDSDSGYELVSEQELKGALVPDSTDTAGRSVIQQVRSQSQRRVRKKQPPQWAVQLVTRGQRLKLWFRETLPDLFRQRRSEMITGIVSLLAHLVVVALLASILLPSPPEDLTLQLTGLPDEEDENLEAVELTEIVQPDSLKDLNVDSTIQQMLGELENGKHRMQFNGPESVQLSMPLEDLVDVSDVPVLKGDFGGRSDAGRRAAVSKYGGSAESEKSVNQGLTWLQKIQRKDGSWNFADVGGAGDPGALGQDTIGATSMALLTFLGGGHTHDKEGIYKETVTKGLSSLLSKAERTSSGLDLRGGLRGNSSMYVQGIATICLCEASALEPKDRTLKRAAIDAINFIERSQDKVGGGWRYDPGDPGDTSVTGWQIMALQSAKSGRITVQNATMRDAREFLDSVAIENGAKYGYMPGGGPSPSMTAVGLLCRMYMGWKLDRREMKAGVEYLAKIGPSRENIYYNYYATQVLHHYGGDAWKQWNLQMRDHLVSTQVKTGPAAGSWDVTDAHGRLGGRIYQTSLSIMTLEVYYRHLPLYRRLGDNAGGSADEAK